MYRLRWFAGVCYSIKQYAREKNSNNKFTWVFNANKMFLQGTVDTFLPIETDIYVKFARTDTEFFDC